MTERCTHGAKRRHPSWWAAKKLSEEKLVAGGGCTFVYRCRSCRGWHLTSEAQRRVPAAVEHVWAL